ncbi:MAG: histidine kinase dimerization/phospho-acceptor domain-containing protein [Oscillibacter sp.]
MYWDVKRHAENLNSIGDGMAAAIDKQLKSERLKTELITNVSHDIKTPLTSIINYVDLCSMSTLPSRRKNTSPSSSGRRSSSKSSRRTWSRPARPRRVTCP